MAARAGSLWRFAAFGTHDSANRGLNERKTTRLSQGRGTKLNPCLPHGTLQHDYQDADDFEFPDPPGSSLTVGPEENSIIQGYLFLELPHSSVRQRIHDLGIISLLMRTQDTSLSWTRH